MGHDGRRASSSSRETSSASELGGAADDGTRPTACTLATMRGRRSRRTSARRDSKRLTPVCHVVLEQLAVDDGERVASMLPTQKKK